MSGCVHRSSGDVTNLKLFAVLKKCIELVQEEGCRLINVDCTVIAETPKILPHREHMQGHIANALGIAPKRVGIKATTNEGMGFVGRHEGIAAMAVAQVEEVLI